MNSEHKKEIVATLYLLYMTKRHRDLFIAPVVDSLIAATKISTRAKNTASVSREEQISCGKPPTR
jgi:hypothetical protein